MASSKMHTLVLTVAVIKAAAAPWYQGINSIKVFSPGDDVASSVWAIYNQMKDAQFSMNRYAVLLRSGYYGDLEMPVGYYTSIIGVGADRNDVTVASFYSLDGLNGGATQNFWRSVEGLTTTNPSITWATSQACPLRRLTINGDLWLSEAGPPHWSSGGYVGNIWVKGRTYVGTQQQFFFRNSQMDGGVAYETGAWNFVFVGVNNAPTASTTGKSGEVSYIPTTPTVAEKPFIVESNGDWRIVVPSVRTNSNGIASDLEGYSIDFADVFVAQPWMSTGQINAGIAAKRALLLTPGVYGLQEPLRVTSDKTNFVVLGIGFPTLVAPPNLATITVDAAGVRVAGILSEAGLWQGSAITEPLVLWRGPNGVGSDIFTRTGAFSYNTGYHPACSRTRTNTHVQIDGQGVVLDNTWFWHADHDDCGKASDGCYSGNGLVVHGRDVSIYGLKVEHMMADMVTWFGENGKVFFFQAELPYDDLNFGNQGFVGYKVDQAVRQHYATGLGIYIVGGLRMPTAFRVPAWATMHNMLIWVITGSVGQFSSVVCTTDGTTHCLQGNQCFSNACYLTSLPYVPPPAPAPPTPPPPTPPSGDWTRYPETNCYVNHGGSPVPGSKDPIEILATLDSCKADCVNAGAVCTGILMPSGQTSPTQCFLRTSINVGLCEKNTGYDLWLRPAALAHNASFEEFEVVV